MKLLLTRREAANALSISESHLDRLTKAGVIPSKKLGRTVRYDPEQLREWLSTI